MLESPRQPPLQASMGEPNPPEATGGAPGIPGAGDHSAIRVPIVRVLLTRTRRARLVALYDDHIVTGVCRGNYSISEPMLAVGGEAELTGQLRKVWRVELSDVAVIQVHHGPLTHHFKLRAHSGTRLRFSLPKDQAGHVAQFLRAKLADRASFHRLRATKTTGVLVVILGAVLGLASMNFMTLDERAPGTLVGLLGLAVTVAGLWLLFGRGAVLTQAVDDTTLPTATHHTARQAVTVAKPPLRSQPLGWTLKLLGVAYWFVLLSPLTDPMWEWVKANMEGAQSYIWATLWFPAPLLVFVGYRLAQRRYEPKQTGDSRNPILFLRPFQDDGHTSLQPSGMTAKATGIRSRSAHARSGRTDIAELLWSAHPIRVMRMIGNYGAGSSEESIARYFERHGPVIAIGKPGERLASPGAARMYLTDDSWQDAILCEMERAQAVIMQPAPSDGVRWELNHIREKVAPNRVLLSLVSYWNNPEHYEELTSVVADTLRVDLPRVIPYLKRPAFVYFDEAWNPHVQELSYKHPVLWPITSDGADLHYSLSGFVEGMQGGTTQPARPPRRIGGPKSWMASLAAMALATILLIGVNALVVTSGEAIKAAAGGISVFSTQGQVARAVARSPKITLHGRAVAYRMAVPNALSTLQPTEAAIEHWLRSPDNHFEMQIVAGNDREDLSTVPQMRLKANSANGGGARATLDSEGPIEQNGVNWIGAQITVTIANGTKIREIVRGTSDSRGTVMIIMHIIESPESEAVYQKLAEESLQSFRFGDATGN